MRSSFHIGIETIPAGLSESLSFVKRNRRNRSVRSIRAKPNSKSTSTHPAPSAEGSPADPTLNHSATSPLTLPLMRSKPLAGRLTCTMSLMRLSFVRQAEAVGKRRGSE
ncbi:metallo-beta-lactamase superfamily protein [Cryptococcus neoformans]|nr:metallo-beta-lactamase superfamily protein [Cryptococcus neoformans var. grubii]